MAGWEEEDWFLQLADTGGFDLIGLFLRLAVVPEMSSMEILWIGNGRESFAGAFSVSILNEKQLKFSFFLLVSLGWLL